MLFAAESFPQTVGNKNRPEHAKVMDKTLNTVVLNWLHEAPFDDPSAAQASPNFSYEEWFAKGKSIPGCIDALIAILDKEDLQHPSGDGMRTAYALGMIGDKRQQAVTALLRVRNSTDLNLRIQAVAALGRQGDAGVLPVLEQLVNDPKEDLNVRANAIISLGHIGAPSSEPLLRKMLKDHDEFLVQCAQEALRLLSEKK